MATSRVRLNLGAAEFPLLSGLYGKTVITPQTDQHYIRPNAFSGSEADKNIGIPQLIFCENVLPTSYGLQSISFDTPIIGTAFEDFDTAFYLRDAGEARTLFVPGIVGTNAQRYTYDQANKVWVTSVKVVPAGAKCTISSLKSRTFVHAEFDDEFWEWNGAWANVVFVGLTPANIKGILAAATYNIAYDYNTIYWSSITDVLDFVPALATGAGSERPISLKGRIVVCYPADDGFIIYTTANAVSAKYTGNARFPWVFKEIKNSSGITDPEQATTEGKGSTQYVYTNDGFMELTSSKAEQIWPTVSEFLGARTIETFDETTKKIVEVVLEDRPLVKIDYVGNRWLVISYGEEELTHALVYDAGLKRWGKLKVTHVDSFEFQGNPGTVGSAANVAWSDLDGGWNQQNLAWSGYGQIITGGVASTTFPYKSLAFLAKDGSVRVANFEFADTRANAVMYLGRISFIRNRLTRLLSIHAEGMRDETSNELLVITSHEGHPDTYSSPYKMPKVADSAFTTWQSKLDGVDHTAIFKGNFRFRTVEVRGMVLGNR